MAFINFSTLECYEDCKDETFIEVDEMIAPVILLLNKKGYQTIYSCSGHLYPSYEMAETNSSDQCYIVFKENYNISKLPYLFEATDIEIGFYIAKFYDSPFGTLDRINEISFTVRDLYFWAYNLLIIKRSFY